MFGKEKENIPFLFLLLIITIVFKPMTFAQLCLSYVCSCENLSTGLIYIYINENIPILSFTLFLLLLIVTIVFELIAFA